MLSKIIMCTALFLMVVLFIVGPAASDYADAYTVRTLVQTRPAVCKEYDVAHALFFGFVIDHRKETQCF